MSRRLSACIAFLLPSPLLLGCDRCYCLLWERERATYTPLAAYGLTAQQRVAFVGRAFAEDEMPLLAVARHTAAPLAANSREASLVTSAPALMAFGAGTLLVLPLTARGALLGALVADYDVPGRQFTPREMTLSAGIANQVAGALEGALLGIPSIAVSLQYDEQARYDLGKCERLAVSFFLRVGGDKLLGRRRHPARGIEFESQSRREALGFRIAPPAGDNERNRRPA